MIGKIPTWECLYVKKKHGLFLSIHVDDLKVVAEKQNMGPMCEILQQEIDLEDPTPL